MAENNVIAYHEAGHAVACIELHVKFKHVTIESNDEKNYLGAVLLNRLNLKIDYDDSLKEQRKAENYITLCLAGPVAEEKYAGNANNITASKDLEDSFGIAQSIYGSEELADAFMKFKWCEAKALFTWNNEEDMPAWEKVQTLAAALLKKKTLSYYEVRKLF